MTVVQNIENLYLVAHQVVINIIVTCSMFMIANKCGRIRKRPNMVAHAQFVKNWTDSRFSAPQSSFSKIDWFWVPNLFLYQPFLARPLLGQVRLPFIVVVVEQGPDVSLLVLGLRICGSHPIPWKKIIEDLILTTFKQGHLRTWVPSDKLHELRKLLK